MRYLFILRLSLLNLLRSWRPTVTLSFMIISAVASLVFLASLAIGTNDAMVQNSVSLFSGHIAGDGIPSQTNWEELGLQEVEDVLVRKQHKYLLWTGEVYEPIVLMGVNPAKEKKNTALWKKTLSGRYLSQKDSGIFLNQTTAERLQVQAGDKVQLGSRPGNALKTFAVTGIYKTGIPHLDQGLAFCPIEQFPDHNEPASVAIFLKEGVHLDTILDQYRQILPQAGFSGWPEFMPDLKQLIDLNFVCMALVMILVFAIVSVGISCAFLIFTLRSLREYGIMKSMGVMPLDTVLLITTQIGLLILFASTVGVFAGVTAVTVLSQHGIDLTGFTSHNQYFSVSGVIYPRLTATAFSAPPLLALFFGLGAAIWPSLFVIRKSPAEILRSV